ncbi:Oidioi.mRNA.OKI2018_I69.XSR.g16914.t1.cds [Oikopleura dioica]|uniref:Oidioi.mRNA.OKI2018_I69.XSR.g16914.t1.cds n=1 Tax=Oikopleura dioica TaxID=34765 RepID=A0ABN7SHK8_OIKDI|nr:Oidioi.mRNA.OKI2018_I69.XSR.g16914.t1.cds [Oikopleura dioica]
MKAVLATLSEFQLKTLEAENSIDNENDCHADAEYTPLFNRKERGSKKERMSQKSPLSGSEPFVRKARHHEEALAQLMAQIELSANSSEIKKKFEIINVDQWLKETRLRE